MFTWLELALAATANLGLFLFTVIYFLKQRQTLTPQITPNSQPQTIPSIQTTNPSTEWLKSTLTNYPTTTTGNDISKTVGERQPQPDSPTLNFKNTRTIF